MFWGCVWRLFVKMGLKVMKGLEELVDYDSMVMVFVVDKVFLFERMS
jgi:hypothetical protein